MLTRAMIKSAHYNRWKTCLMTTYQYNEVRIDDTKVMPECTNQYTPSFTVRHTDPSARLHKRLARTQNTSTCTVRLFQRGK